MVTIVVAPPLGPLSWLFPEVEDLAPDLAPDVAADLDLRTDPRSAAELLAELSAAEEVVVVGGPRGRTLARFLQQRFRVAGPRVRVDDSLPHLEAKLETAAPDLPFFVSDLRPATIATTRLPESFWGVLPGDHYPADVREAHHARLRRDWPDRYLSFCALENAALTGIDLYDEMLRGRYDTAQERPQPPADGPLILGVDGIDGAGKSSQLRALREHLEARGLVVEQCKIYRHGVFHDTVTDLTRQCREDRNLHLWPLQRRVKLFDSLKYYYSRVAPALGRCDVMLFDRYVQTHYAAGLGRYGHDPYAREMLSVFPVAHRVFLLDLPETTALRRLAERETLTVDENPYMLSRFRAALLEQVAVEQLTVLDSEASLESNVRRICAEVDGMLEARR